MLLLVVLDGQKKIHFPFLQECGHLNPHLFIFMSQIYKTNYQLLCPPLMSSYNDDLHEGERLAEEMIAQLFNKLAVEVREEDKEQFPTELQTKKNLRTQVNFWLSHDIPP